MSEVITLQINGQTVCAPAGSTVLQAARQAGIVIPTLCEHADLTPYGGCRLCVVEVQGARLPATSCTLPITQGMVVTTNSPALFAARRAILELMLSVYAESETPVEAPETQFHYWLRQHGLDPAQAQFNPLRYAVDSDPNPFLRVDMNRCIVCGRCVRACAEIQGRFVWGFAGRGAGTHPVPGADTELLAARCESCGACAAYCPTGAIDHKLSYGLGQADRTVTTTCTYCGVGCQFDFNVKDERIIRVTSNPNAPVNGTALCVKGRYGYDFVHHPERVLRPRVRRYLLEGTPRPVERGEWVEVDWETALNLAARRLVEIRSAHGPDSIGVLTSAKCTNEENYLMNKFARQVVGTNGIDHCARL